MSEPEYKLLSVSQISTNAEFQPREKLDEFHVERIAEQYAAWKKDGCGHPCPIDRPVVYRIGGIYQLTSGFTRLAGAKKAGVEKLEFEVRRGSKPDAMVHAATANLENKSMPMTKTATRKAMCMYYDHFVGSPAVKVLARMFFVSEDTVRRWLDDHDPNWRDEKVRVKGNGVAIPVGNAVNQHTVKKPDLFTQDNETEEKEDVEEGDQGATGGEDHGAIRAMPPVPQPEKPTPKAEEKKAGDDPYPPDERFMPQAVEAQEICVLFASVKQRMEAVRSELQKKLPRGHAVGDQMIDFHGQFTADLNALIETLGHNKPERVCPLCVGTTVRDNGDPCETCNRYGFVNRTDADGNKKMWDRTGKRYDDEVKKADLAEACE